MFTSPFEHGTRRQRVYPIAYSSLCDVSCLLFREFFLLGFHHSCFRCFLEGFVIEALVIEAFLAGFLYKGL